MTGTWTLYIHLNILHFLLRYTGRRIVRFISILFTIFLCSEQISLCITRNFTMFDIREVQFGEHSLQFLYVHNIFHFPMGIWQCFTLPLLYSIHYLEFLYVKKIFDYVLGIVQCFISALSNALCFPFNTRKLYQLISAQDSHLPLNQDFCVGV